MAVAEAASKVIQNHTTIRVKDVFGNCAHSGYDWRWLPRCFRELVSGWRAPFPGSPVGTGNGDVLSSGLTSMSSLNSESPKEPSALPLHLLNSFNVPSNLSDANSQADTSIQNKPKSYGEVRRRWAISICGPLRFQCFDTSSAVPKSDILAV